MLAIAEKVRKSLCELGRYDRLLAVLLFLIIVLAAALSPMQSDTWWQLRAGRDMWSSLRVLLVDRYSHTAYGAFWPNHEWLSEVIFYGLYRAGGLALLSLFATALIVCGWLISWHLTEAPVRHRFLMMAPVLVPASFHWEPRPHAFSLLFTMITVYLLVRQLYLWLPVIFVVWANCHGGVLLGFVVLTVGLAATLIARPGDWRRASLVLVACLLATTVTPLGTRYWTEIAKSLTRIHLYPLDEWRRPSVADIRLLPFWIAAGALCLVSFQRRGELRKKNDRTLILCASSFVLLPLALLAIRNVGVFLMLAVPAIAALLDIDPHTHSLAARRERPLLNVSIMFGAVLAVTVTIGAAYRHQIGHLRWTPLSLASLEALQRCPGNLYNRYDEGGYLIWFAPDRPVFLDGRQDPYDRSLILDQIRIEASGDYSATFSRYRIRCAYLPVTSPVVARLVSAGWLAVYREPEWVVLAQ